MYNRRCHSRHCEPFFLGGACRGEVALLTELKLEDAEGPLMRDCRLLASGPSSSSEWRSFLRGFVALWMYAMSSMLIFSLGTSITTPLTLCKRIMPFL